MVPTSLKVFLGGASPRFNAQKKEKTDAQVGAGPPDGR